MLYVRSLRKLLFFLSPLFYIHSWGCWLLGLLNVPNLYRQITYLRYKPLRRCSLAPKEGKAVSLVSSFGSGVGYSSSLGHFLITAVKGGVEATRS